MAKSSKTMNRELWQAFITFIEEPGAPTLNEIARSIAWSAAALSSYKKGTYTGDVPRLEADLVGYLQRDSDRKEAPTLKSSFVKNTTVNRIYEVALAVHLDREMGLLTGRAGVGKTEGLAWYLRDNTDCLYISANNAFTARVCFSKILEILGLPRTAGLQMAFEYAVAKLKDTGRMLIIDQAEYLSHSALEMLRSLHDEAKIGLLLVGLPRLFNNIRHEGAVHEQVYSRIGIYHNLDDKLSPEEAEQMFMALTGHSKPVPGLHSLCRGNARRLVKLAKRSQTIAKNFETEISEDVLEQAVKYLVL